jgi:mannose-1-phosphate guanylyltransferase
MLAVVLVGGFGTRLRPLTNDVPKPMLPIVHRPMIVRLVDRLALAGVTDVVLALGFKPEPFAAAFPGERHGDLRLHYAVEPEPLDTGGAIGFAARFVGADDTFIVANGDIITDVDVAALVDRHREVGADATLHLTPVDDPSAFGVVETAESGHVRRFVEKPAPGTSDSNLINAGTYVFEPAVLDLIGVNERVSIERSTFPQLVEQGRLAGWGTEDYWLDTGRPHQYLQANLDLISGVRGDPPEAVAASAMVDPSADVAGSVIGERATVAAGARVSGSVLMPGATVGHDAVVETSIIAGNVGGGAEVRGSVIGSTWTVADGATLSDAKLPSPA